MEWLFFKIESWVGKFQRFHSLNDEQMGAAVHLLRSKDVAAILPSDFEESLISQPYATAKKWMVRILLKQIQLEEMIRSIVLSTKDDVLPLIGVTEFNIVFGRQQRTFWCKIPKHVIEWRFSSIRLCYAHCSCSVSTSSEKILRTYARRLAKIPQANSKRTSAFPTNIGRTACFRLSPPLRRGYTWIGVKFEVVLKGNC